MTGGLIPAHAGKTPRCCPGGPRTRAHPRSRGENGRTITGYRRRYGSSPLTRGKPHARGRVCDSRRLIPAHAGKTPAVIRAGDHARAHPRSRGENMVHASRSHRCWGSSPLTRGKRWRAARTRCACRLIPAHAGKTKKVPLGASGQAAHPRSRGENSQSFEQTPVPSWLIPAHAGKTRCDPFPRLGRAAHPRSRGENDARRQR